MDNKNIGITSVAILFFAHMMNDMYSNFLPQLTAVLILGDKLSVSAGTLIIAVFTISSSIAQPIFGYLIDQKGQRWFVHVGTLWMAVLLSMTGYISSVALLMLIAAAAGMGTAAFHPQAASMVGISSKKNKGLVMSSFIAMGNLGLAISPVLLLPLFHNYGVEYTWVAIFPGLLAALLLYFYAPRISIPAKKDSPKLSQLLKSIGNSSNSELFKLIVIVVLRSVVHTGLMTLLPIYFLSRDFSAEFTGSLIFAALTAGSVGGIIGGYISDRFGSKPLVFCSMLLASASFYGFFTLSGPVSFILLGFGTMFLLSSFSVTVILAQELIPENTALASGLSMGFAVGIGGLGVSLVGRYADIFGIDSAMQLLFFVPLLAAVLAIFLKNSTETGLHAQIDAPTSDEQ